MVFVKGGASGGVLAGEALDSCSEYSRVFGLGVVVEGVAFGDGNASPSIRRLGLFADRLRCDQLELDLPRIPPIQLCYVGDATFLKPLLIPQRHEEVGVWVFLHDPQRCRMAQVVVMIMADDHSIDERQMLDLAWRWRIPLQVGEVDRRATVFEDGIEEHPKPGRELNVVTRVT